MRSFVELFALLMTTEFITRESDEFAQTEEPTR